ncbi:MAG: hydroxyisourate hydrolase [Bacteroidota bacterium]
MSQITTHVLDTSKGSPGKGIHLRLQSLSESGWTTIGKGITNDDGRVSDLLPDEEILKPGTYRMWFDTGAYFKAGHIKSFYPEVGIVFEVFDDSHYHVPLLLNPFGYSTYRGS